MNGYNLIPFGLRNVDKNLVDISAVTRGAKCDCICPSCKTPLTARQGEKNEWHFAHRSKKSFEQTKKECEYSYFVSVRLMIKQLIVGGSKLLTPSFKGSYTHYMENSSTSVNHEFQVTKPTLLEINNADVEVVFAGHNVDFIFQVGGFSIVVFVCYESRPFPFFDRRKIGEKHGVIIIDLHLMPNLFTTAKQSNQPYVDVLKEYLATELAGKSWYHHPRYDAALERVKQKVVELQQAQLEMQRSIEASTYNTTATKAQTQYNCIMCGNSWLSNSHDGRTCERCRTHLYVVSS